MDRLIRQVKKTISSNFMVNIGDVVIIALSGGPDSVVLLHVLNTLREDYKLTLYVAHVNHGIRGSAADADEAYAVEFSKKLGIQSFVLREKVEEFAKTRGISSEMAGREIRYKFFEELKHKLKADKIAIAHNANDQAETVLMRIMRGTGMDGIEGIRPVRDNIYIRPLIDVSRAEIERYCEQNILNPRIDATNLETIYSRNKVRIELIPYIQKNFNPDIINTLIRLSDTVKKDNEYLENLVEEKYKNYCEVIENKVIISKNAFSEPDAILSRIIRKAYNMVAKDLINFEKKHIYDIIKLQSRSSGKSIDLLQGINAYNNYGHIEIGYSLKENKDSKWRYKLPINSRVYIEEIKSYVETEVISYKKDMIFSKSYLIRYFDYDKIKNDISIRNRENADSFIPFGMSGKKKLKDYFINEKIPKAERDNLPLICFDGNIAWVVGYRTSDIYKITEKTKNIIKIKIEV